MAPLSHDRVLERKVLFPGHYLFKEGDPGDVAYVVQEGCIEVVKAGRDGKEVILGLIRQGGLLGEMSLIDEKPRMASARARDQTTVVMVNRQTFQSKLEAADPFIRGLLKIFVRNIRDITDRMV